MVLPRYVLLVNDSIEVCAVRPHDGTNYLSTTHTRFACAGENLTSTEVDREIHERHLQDYDVDDCRHQTPHA